MNETRIRLRLIHAIGAPHPSPEEWVELCIAAAIEAYNDVLNEPPLEPETSLDAMLERTIGDLLPPRPREPLRGAALEALAQDAGSAAYRCTMPRLTSRRTIQCFVACVAAGMVRQYLTGKDANALLYAAQAALGAYPKRKARKGGK